MDVIRQGVRLCGRGERRQPALGGSQVAFYILLLEGLKEWKDTTGFQAQSASDGFHVHWYPGRRTFLLFA